MFKGTNKTWKAIALVLALCMSFSTMVVFATGTTVEFTETTTKEAVEAEYEADGTMTVAGTISDADADVTILAVRSTGNVELTTVGAWDSTQLADQVVYIDQEQATDGAFSFSFIPKTDATGGGTVAIFVGGEGVLEPITLYCEAKNPAPGMVAATWYEGDALTMNLVKVNDQTAAYPATTAWSEDINELSVTYSVGEAAATTETIGNDNAQAKYYVVDTAANTLKIHGLGDTGVTVTKIETTSTSDFYKAASWTGTATQGKRPTPTLGTVDAAVAGETVQIPVTLTETDYDTDWISGIANSVSVTGDGAGLGSAVWNNGYIDAVITLNDSTLTSAVTVTVAVDYYNSVSTAVTVKAPTQAAADKAAVERNYVKVNDEYAMTIPDSETEANEDNLLNMYGFAVVTLPTPEENSGLVYAWDVTDPAGATATEDIANDAASVTLDRPDYVAPGSETVDTVSEYVYTLKLTVTKDGCAAATKNFTVSVSRMGMKGATVEITHNFSNDAVAETATYQLTPAGSQPSENDLVIAYDEATESFSATAVPLGNYTLTIKRPGFVTRTVEVVVASTGLELAEGATWPTMVAGDLDDDGKIYSSDLQLLLAAYNKAEGAGYSPTADLDADGKVYSSDLQLLLASYNKVQ